ncbi:hypothetical protein LXL04_016726 [Taraxacum kok-saghyz]
MAYHSPVHTLSLGYWVWSDVEENAAEVGGENGVAGGEHRPHGRRRPLRVVVHRSRNGQERLVAPLFFSSFSLFLSFSSLFSRFLSFSHTPQFFFVLLVRWRVMWVDVGIPTPCPYLIALGANSRQEDSRRSLQLSFDDDQTLDVSTIRCMNCAHEVFDEMLKRGFKRNYKFLKSIVPFKLFLKKLLMIAPFKKSSQSKKRVDHGWTLGKQYKLGMVMSFLTGTTAEATSPNSLIQSVQSGTDANSATATTSTMESMLSLNDGSWIRPSQQPRVQFDSDDFFSGYIIRQPSPLPVLACVQPQHSAISPTRVADPRPGAAKSYGTDAPTSNGHQHLHIPLKMMQDFLRLAQEMRRIRKRIWKRVVFLKNRVFHITTLIIPKHESTSDSVRILNLLNYMCQTLNEEDIFEVEDKRSLFQLRWIQIMLPEATAIVMAPTDESGYFI